MADAIRDVTIRIAVEAGDMSKAPKFVEMAIRRSVTSHQEPAQEGAARLRLRFRACLIAQFEERPRGDEVNPRIQDPVPHRLRGHGEDLVIEPAAKEPVGVRQHGRLGIIAT